jgi:hypothetical protein
MTVSLWARLGPGRLRLRRRRVPAPGRAAAAEGGGDGGTGRGGVRLAMDDRVTFTHPVYSISDSPYKINKVA